MIGYYNTCLDIWKLNKYGQTCFVFCKGLVCTIQSITCAVCTYQSVTHIFEYSNILVTNIYTDIRSYQFFFYEYIRTFVRVKFVCTNIFRHSLVSVLECKTLTNIRIYSNIRAIFITNTYSDIRSCQKN